MSMLRELNARAMEKQTRAGSRDFADICRSLIAASPGGGWESAHRIASGWVVKGASIVGMPSERALAWLHKAAVQPLGVPMTAMEDPNSRAVRALSCLPWRPRRHLIASLATCCRCHCA